MLSTLRLNRAISDKTMLNFHSNPRVCCDVILASFQEELDILTIVFDCSFIKKANHALDTIGFEDLSSRYSVPPWWVPTAHPVKIIFLRINFVFILASIKATLQ